MKAIYINASSVILILIFLLSSCNDSIVAGKTKQDYTSLDSVWLPFAKAMESKDIEFLINNSLDSVTCYDCNIDSANHKIYFKSDFIFKNHLDKIKHLPTLTDRHFSSYQDNNSVTIVYNIKSYYAPEGAYGLIFTIVKKEKKYYFQGMLVQ